MKTSNTFEQHRQANAWLMGLMICTFVLGAVLLCWVSYNIGYSCGSQVVKTRVANKCPEYDAEDVKMIE